MGAYLAARMARIDGDLLLSPLPRHRLSDIQRVRVRVCHTSGEHTAKAVAALKIH